MRPHTKFLAATTILVACMAVPAAAQAADAIAQRSGTLRAGPGSDFPSIDHISSGDELEVYGCTDGYSWCDVSDGDNRGWFPGSRIAYLRDGRREILPEVGAAIGIGIIGFGVEEYWGAHYHNRPFFRQEHTFASRYHGPGPGGPIPGNNHPPGNPPPHFTPPVHAITPQPHVTTPHPHVNAPVIHNNAPVVHNNAPVIHNNAPRNVPHNAAPECPGGMCHSK